MKILSALLKLSTIGIWGPFWIVKKFWPLLVTMLSLGLITGCATTDSGVIQKSPCACNFTPISTITKEIDNG